jgi:hypothetical protein
MMIWQALDDRGITTPAGIGEALGMPGPDAAKLLTRRQWHEGDVALLEAAVARLGWILSADEHVLRTTIAHRPGQAGLPVDRDHLCRPT